MKTFFITIALVATSFSDTALDWPGDGSVRRMVYWHNPFPIYDATYIFKVYPRKKTTTATKYYTTFFWGNDGLFWWDNHNGNTYYGAHPYPKPAPGVKPPGGASPKAKPKTPNGRPGGSSTGPTGNQSNPRGPKGQNVASLLEMQETLQRRGRAMLDRLESFISHKVLAAKAIGNPQLKNIKNLRSQERERLEWLIYNVFSHMPAPKGDEMDLADDSIVSILRSDTCEDTKHGVLSTYENKVADYVSTYGKAPTREMRRQFMVSSWTQQAILEHVAEMPLILDR